MKNLNKVLALVLACAMLFTMSSFAFTDVAEDASYIEAVTMLSKLGIITGYEDGSFLPDNTITRAEAAKVLVCTLNAADQAEGMQDQNLFTDVPASHWAAGYVNYAANYGVINGRGNGIFDPEAPVTYEEMVKMIVAMLGYTPVANIKGGYPTGYLYVANNMLKITKGATGITGDAAKRWVVARLVFNALEAKIMEQDKWSATDPEYVQGDSTLLKDYLEVTKLEGILVDSFLLDAPESLDKEDQDVTIEIATIDGMTLRVLENNEIDYTYMPGDDYTVDANGTGAEAYLGYTIVAYVKDYDEGTDELVAIAPKAGKNATLTVAFDKFAEDSAEVTTKAVEFEYFAEADADDTTTGKINLFAKGIVAITNNDSETIGDDSDTEELIDGIDPEKEGVVTFLDNDGNGYFDYIFVEEISDEYVVDSITAKSYKIKDAISNRNVVLDPTDEEAYVNFFKDGVQVEFSDIAEGDVLSVSANSEGNITTVYLSSDKVEGYVATANATKNKYKIGETVYAKSASNDDSLTRGMEGTFYLNYNGRIAYAAAEKSADGSYGFILTAGYDSDFADGVTYTIRFMNDKGEWVDADIYEKLAVCDSEGNQIEKYKNIDEFVANIETDTEGWVEIDGEELVLAGALTQRVFKYTLNSDGQITKILLPVDGLVEDEFSYDDFSGAEYNAGSNRFSDIPRRLGVDEATVVFTIDADDVVTNAETDPVETRPGTIADVDRKTEVSLASYTMFKDEQSYDGYAYDLDEAYKCMVITNAGNSIDDEAALLVIDTAELVSDGDEEFYVINGYMGGEAVELEAIEDLDVNGLGSGVELDEIASGSVAEIATDAAGKVEIINVVFEADDADYVLGAGATAAAFGDDEGVDYFFGAIGAKAYGKAQMIELYDELTFDGDGELTAEADASIITAGSGMVGNIYVVTTTAGGNTKIAVDTSIADYTGSIDDTTEDGDKVYVAFAKTYDGDTIDIVVYRVEAVDAE